MLDQDGNAARKRISAAANAKVERSRSFQLESRLVGGVGSFCKNGEMARLALAALLVALATIPAFGQESSPPSTQKPDAVDSVVRSMNRDPGLKCRFAMDAQNYEDAEDYCRQAAIIEGAQKSEYAPSSVFYPMALSSLAWDQYNAAFSILSLSFGHKPTLDAATLRKNYGYALTFAVPCSKNAALAIAAAKSEKQRAALGKTASRVKQFCDGLIRAIRKRLSE